MLEADFPCSVHDVLRTSDGGTVVLAMKSVTVRKAVSAVYMGSVR